MLGNFVNLVTTSPQPTNLSVTYQLVWKDQYVTTMFYTFPQNNITTMYDKWTLKLKRKPTLATQEASEGHGVTNAHVENKRPL